MLTRLRVSATEPNLRQRNRHRLAAYVLCGPAACISLPPRKIPRYKSQPQSPAPFTSSIFRRTYHHRPLRALQLTKLLFFHFFQPCAPSTKPLLHFSSSRDRQTAITISSPRESKAKRVRASKKCIYHCHQATSSSTSNFSVVLSQFIGVASLRFPSSLDPSFEASLSSLQQTKNHLQQRSRHQHDYQT